jgi:hypothetical protein
MCIFASPKPSFTKSTEFDYFISSKCFSSGFFYIAVTRTNRRLGMHQKLALQNDKTLSFSREYCNSIKHCSKCCSVSGRYLTKRNNDTMGVSFYKMHACLWFFFKFFLVVLYIGQCPHN